MIKRGKENGDKNYERSVGLGMRHWDRKCARYEEKKIKFKFATGREGYREGKTKEIEISRANRRVSGRVQLRRRKKGERERCKSGSIHRHAYTAEYGSAGTLHSSRTLLKRDFLLTVDTGLSFRIRKSFILNEILFKVILYVTWKDTTVLYRAAEVRNTPTNQLPLFCAELTNVRIFISTTPTP